MLQALTAQLERRVNRLETELIPLLIEPLTDADRRQAEHITFQLQNVWEMYVRNFVLLSATGHAIDSNGPIMASAPYRFRSRETVRVLLQQRTGDRFEPKWYRPVDAIRAARRLNIHNLSNFAAAIGSTPWPLEDLRLTRNFFAHRSRSSALELRALAWFPRGDIISVETTLMPFGAGGVRRVNGWCSSMKLIANAML